MSDELTRIMAWYQSRCDGVWELQNKIAVETTDKPGWKVTIPFPDSAAVNRRHSHAEDYRPERNWIACRIEDGVFHGACGPPRLNKLLGTFLSWAEQHETGTESVDEISRKPSDNGDAPEGPACFETGAPKSATPQGLTRNESHSPFTYFPPDENRPTIRESLTKLIDTAMPELVEELTGRKKSLRPVYKTVRNTKVLADPWSFWRNTIQAGDETWDYSTVRSVRGFPSGTTGLALVRSGEVIEWYISELFG